jgi:hypothetical protein
MSLTLHWYDDNFGKMKFHLHTSKKRIQSIIYHTQAHSFRVFFPRMKAKSSFVQKSHANFNLLAS